MLMAAIMNNDDEHVEAESLASKGPMKYLGGDNECLEHDDEAIDYDKQ